MLTVTRDLGSSILDLVRRGVLTKQIVIVEEHPDYPGQLVFQVLDDSCDQDQQFYQKYQDWISRYFVLSQLHNFFDFVELLENDGHRVLLDTSAGLMIPTLMRWRAPLNIEGYDLHPFQEFGLNRAFEQDFFFFNWATGSGKSFICAAGAKELFTREQIDVVIACTIDKGKINLCRFFQRAGLTAVVNDGSKDKRRKGYRSPDTQVFVMNYEKLRVDFTELEDLVRNRRVLWIFNEAYKIGTADKWNKARDSFERLIRLCAPGSKVWPMSASAVNGNPLRYHDMFTLGGQENPLGSRNDFVIRYADRVRTVDKVVPGRPYTIPLTFYDWDIPKLAEVHHRVGGLTQVIRKTDPGVREHFKGLTPVIEPIQMDAATRKLTEVITGMARAARKRGESLEPYYRVLRYVCNTPYALALSAGLGEQIIRDHRKLVTDCTSFKLARLNEHLETIRDQGDRVLVFTQWTNLTLHLIAPDITVPHVLHYGVGQSAKESQRVQDKFWDDPDITCFLTSDAGSHELNMQCARYVIQYDPTYSYDTAMQRASRIDRSDSHLDGLTNYQYVTENSVEERVMSIQNARRMITEAVQGSVESLSADDKARAQMGEPDNFAWMIFGND